MGEARLEGRRILVVGASSGIGRELALHAAAHGARLACVARRDSDAGAASIRADVREPKDCERLVAESVGALGGLDALVYATGVTPLAWLADADAAHWHDTFATNVVGAALVTRAALPHLRGGLAAYVSSDSVGRPRHGLAAYSASKAALDEMILAFRTEHPDTRFLRIVVGPTIGTEVGRDYDVALLGELLGHWKAHAFPTEQWMQAGELGALLADVLASCLAHPGIAVDDLRLEPPGSR